MKIGKILWLVLALVIGMPGVSMAGEGHAVKQGRHVASTKSKKKAKKGKGAKHAKGKKKGKAAKGKKGKAAKGKKAAKAHKAGGSHQSHAPSDSPVQEPVPGMNMPAEPKDDLPPPNNGNLSE